MVVPGLPYFYWKDIDFCACVCVGKGMIVVLDWLLLTGETLPRVWGICRPLNPVYWETLSDLLYVDLTCLDRFDAVTDGELN